MCTQLFNLCGTAGLGPFPMGPRRKRGGAVTLVWKPKVQRFLHVALSPGLPAARELPSFPGTTSSSSASTAGLCLGPGIPLSRPPSAILLQLSPFQAALLLSSPGSELEGKEAWSGGEQYLDLEMI